MNIFVVVVIIFIISFIWALFSLREFRHGKETKNVEEELKKGRVVYHNESSSDE